MNKPCNHYRNSEATQARQELLAQITAASDEDGGAYLTYNRFRELSGVPISRIYGHFDSWTEACRAAGVTPGEASPTNITPNYSKGKTHALSELKRIAQELGVATLSKTQFDAQDPDVKACTISRLWGSWRAALNAAGLQLHPNFHEEIPLADVAQEFLHVVDEIGAIPTVNQMTRRSRHCKNTFTRKFGSYTQFKIAAIGHILDQPDVPAETQCALRAHLEKLTPPAKDTPSPATHHKGRHLGFRAFAFAPTNESDVVAMFGAVADDLGFEIVSTRGPFPDCKARRKTRARRARYESCLIEFEFQSSDFRRHGHPVNGCNLIVCWEHDWKDCPLEVLELRTEIQKLGGWT